MILNFRCRPIFRFLLDLFHEPLQNLQFLPLLYVQCHNELEEVPGSENIDTLLPEELVDVGYVSPQEFKGVGVVVFD